jgi:hypothetical protein
MSKATYQQASATQNHEHEHPDLTLTQKLQVRRQHAAHSPLLFTMKLHCAVCIVAMQPAASSQSQHKRRLVHGAWCVLKVQSAAAYDLR